MENKEYIISFGNSTKYRISPSAGELADIKKDITEYLLKKFPQLAALKFYDKMTVTLVDPSNASEFEGYKEFNADSVDEIKKILSGEVNTASAVAELNSNAPWGIGAEKD